MVHIRREKDKRSYSRLKVWLYFVLEMVALVIISTAVYAWSNIAISIILFLAMIINPYMRFKKKIKQIDTYGRLQD